MNRWRKTGRKSPIPILVVVLLLVCQFASAREIVVTSTRDGGTDTLRWALETARSGDTITFDPEVFPPDAPATIRLASILPSITQGSLTIDASNAGVILNGEDIARSNAWGLEVVSNGNTIQGLMIVNFTGAAIQIVGGAQHNTIGGDRFLGAGPLGQGNLCSGSNPGPGIGLYETGTSHNTITGNLVGTDASGNGSKETGNIDGIFLSGGASHNTIGPDNIIAYNYERAIVIQGSESLSNWVTRNSIHDNGRGGILLLDGGNRELPPPLITSFDAISGELSGTTCPGCTVELFSEETSWEDCDGVRRQSAEGRSFEGSTTATSAGAFSLSTGFPFVYPHLTATATDSDGNTSELSLATSGIIRSWGLQVGNERLLRQLATPQPQHEYNRIGTMLPLLDSAGTGDMEGIMYVMDSLGQMWDKFYIDVPDWPEVGVLEGYSDGNVTPTQDSLVDRFVEQRLKVVLGLVFWDESANDRILERGAAYSRYETEEEVQAYLDHIQSIVRHFRGRVEYYEILNEPNAHKAAGVQQYVSATQYINLVRRAVPVIRREDPQAKIVIGAVACVGMEQQGFEYLRAIAGSDVMPLVDVISWHPFDGASPDTSLRDYYYEYPDLVGSVRDTAARNGFTGEYMASEMQWRTPLTDVIELADILGTANPDDRLVHSATQAAKYYAREIALNLGMDVIVGTGGEGLVTSVHSVIRNLSTVMAGHEAIDMPAEIDIDYGGPVAYCAFRYPNGERMLALWTDGIAEDVDPGIPAIITFPGLTADAVAGIDILCGFEQELIFETAEGNTIIRDLLIKDYPILIRLSNPTFGPDYTETVGSGFHRLGGIPSPRVIVVTSAADSGDGTLRSALQTAREGETITFDPSVFPPDAPATIRLTSGMLPILNQGGLTLDASNAGVIIDGIDIRETNAWCLGITSSENTIQGLQIVNFTGTGIEVVGGAQHNLIGGDRSIGEGPLGQGNLCSANGRGIGIYDAGTSHNVIMGNLVGTDVSGASSVENGEGIRICSGASHNTIGPNNIIAYNRGWGIVIQGSSSLANQIVGNSLHDNAEGNILQEEEGG